MIERAADRLRVTTPMVMSNADGLLEAGRNAFRGRREIVDFANVSEVDSSALAVALGWLRAAQTNQCSLLFINVPASMRALADLYGIDDILPLA